MDTLVSISVMPGACPASFLFPINKVNYNGGNKNEPLCISIEKITRTSMCGSQDSLSVHQPLLSSFHEIFTKRLIIANHFYRHLPDDSTKISAASLGYFALSNMLARLMNRWIQTSKGYNLLCTFKLGYVSSDLAQKLRRRSFSYALNRCHNFDLLLQQACAQFVHGIRQFLHSFTHIQKHGGPFAILQTLLPCLWFQQTSWLHV